jgi:hypothetical protein
MLFYRKGLWGRKIPLPFVVYARKAVILRGQIWSTHESDVVGLITEKIEAGTRWLEQLLEGLQFLSAYQLGFIQEIKVRRTQDTRLFSHDLVQMTGCFTIFDHQRWESAVDLQPERVILLAASANGRSLLSPIGRGKTPAFRRQL